MTDELTICDAAAKDDEDGTGLFGPPPPRPDCDICFLPMPLVYTEVVYMTCCGKMICAGCCDENRRVIKKKNKNVTCMFCRTPEPATSKEGLARLEKRANLNDADAIFELALDNRMGLVLVPKDENKAFELSVRSAELGCAAACCEVAVRLLLGEVVQKDKRKARIYFVKAVQKGDVFARHCLAYVEFHSGNKELACRHWQIAAAAGYQDSVDALKETYDKGNTTKDIVDEAARACQAANDKMKSEARDRWAVEKEKRK